MWRPGPDSSEPLSHPLEVNLGRVGFPQEEYSGGQEKARSLTGKNHFMDQASVTVGDRAKMSGWDIPAAPSMSYFLTY